MPTPVLPMAGLGGGLAPPLPYAPFAPTPANLLYMQLHKAQQRRQELLRQQKQAR
jgi:hypothetical protein